jgi:hypothetical protein
MVGVAAPYEAALAAFQLPHEFVHHGVESGHAVAGHRPGPHDVAATYQCHFADFALGHPSVGLLDKPDLSALDDIEVAIEVTDFLVDGET